MAENVFHCVQAIIGRMCLWHIMLGKIWCLTEERVRLGDYRSPFPVLTRGRFPFFSNKSLVFMKTLIKCDDLPSEATVESPATQNRKLSSRQNIAEHFVLSFEITHRAFRKANYLVRQCKYHYSLNRMDCLRMICAFLFLKPPSSPDETISSVIKSPRVLRRINLLKLGD
jgi:hypothetical protein